MSEGFRLSPFQRHLWRQLSGLRAGPLGRRLSLTVELRGPLELEALHVALQACVRRHEVLRARFSSPERTSELRQSVLPEGRAVLEQHDLSGLVAREQREQAARIAAQLGTPHQLDGSAPLHLALLTLAPDHYLLVLAQSALATDWRSLWNLAIELTQALSGQRVDEDPTQFADLAQWFHDTLEGEDAAAGLDFWRRVDLNAAGDLRLPLEAERASGGGEPSGECRRSLAREQLESLRGFAQGRRIRLQAFLCALWQTLLARASERDELVIGVRAAGRTFQGLEEAVGPFSRFLPVPARIDERTSLMQLARSTDEFLSQGEEWHELFEPELLGCRAVAPFAYAFEFLPWHEPVELGPFRLRPRSHGGQAESFRGLLSAREQEHGLELRFAHDPRFLGRAEAEVLADEFMALLRNAVQRPEAPLSSMSMCPPEMRTHVLLRFSRGPELAAPEESAHESILAAARAQPTATAVRTQDLELDYGALERRSAILARELRALGVGPGSFVGLHLGRSPELVVALLAVLRAGGAYVPLPSSYPRERLRFVLQDCGAQVVIGSERTHHDLEGYEGRILRLGEPAGHAGAATLAGTNDIDQPPRPEDPAYVIYTSGSTGRPKGVAVSHANLASSTRARRSHYQGRVGAYLLLSSFAFDSSVAGIFWTLAQGGTLILPPEGFERDLTQLPALIARHRPTHLLALPSLWSLVLEQARDGQLDSLGTVIVAGESCPPELVRRHQRMLGGARLHNEYGPTEGTVWSTVFDLEAHFDGLLVPIGRPIPGARVYVLGEDREPAPIGVAGELWIAGPGVVAGYIQREELTAMRFVDDPFATELGAPAGRMYRSGDRARWLANGQLEFLGRADQQVKIRGYRIELEEIEAALGEHPAVRECAVLARSDEGRGTQLVAYVTPLGPRPTEVELAHFLGQRLPEYMLPSRTLLLDSLPRLPNGKVDRSALPAPEEPQGHVEPRGALETVLAALWADVLGLERVGRHDDFFALGGHSLSATRLYARLKETLQVSIPLRALFEHRTPAALAQELVRDPAQAGRVLGLAELVLTILESTEEEERALGA